MKSKTLSLFFSSIFILVLLLASISAYTVNYPVYSATVEDNLSLTKTTNAVNNLTVIGYRCLNSACTSIDTTNPVAGLSAQVTNNIVPVVFPSTYYSLGYILYFYKPGYIGWAQRDNAWGSGSATGVNIYLSKKLNSGAQIFNFLVDTNSGLTSATIDSAIKTTQFATIPLLEKVYTTVNFKINNTQTGQIVNTMSKDYLISYSLNQDVNFSYNFSQLAAGNYTVTISTDVNNEDKIINKIIYSVSHDIFLSSNNGSINNGTNVTNSTLPVITINNPVNGNNYTNGSVITLNGTSTQLVNWSYTLNGNFSNPGLGLVINLPLNSTNLINGTNVLVIYASNANGTVNRTIIFNYNGTIVPVIPTIPLASIAILSPNQNNYNVTQLTINLSSTNSQAVWFNWNGTNQLYTVPVIVNFRNNGTYTLFAYANNSIGNVTAVNFTFRINTSLGDTTAPVITNITTNPNITSPGSNYTNNGTTQNVSVNFTSNEYPINITFNLYNITNLENTSGPFTLQNASGLPLTYIIPNNLSNGIYFLNMTVSDSLGNTATYVVGNFTVVRPTSNGNNGTNNTTNDDDDEDSDSDHNEGEVLNFGANSNYSISESNATMGLIDLTSKKQSLTQPQWILYWLLLLILILLLILVLILIFRKIN